MKLLELTEFISAFAALMTVSLAVIELTSRSSIKKADNAIEIYADFLHIIQQLEYIAKNSESFAKKCAGYSQSELRSYAQTHTIDSALFELVHRFEKNCICNFDYTSQEGKSNSKIALDFAGAVSNYIVSNNTFYRAILEKDDFTPESILEHQKRLHTEYEKVAQNIDSLSNLLRGNLKKLHSNSNKYILFLILSAVAFITICIIL